MLVDATASTSMLVETVNGVARLTRPNQLAHGDWPARRATSPTSMRTDTLSAADAIASDHACGHVEQSFRKSKADRRARPMFYHKRESIEGPPHHVFAALAIARYLQERFGISVKKLVQTLQPLREVTINIAGRTITAKPQPSDEATGLLDP